MSYLCYILVSFDSSKTYIGITNDFSHRIRQHNGEIKGGAKYTSQGRPWRCAALITGFTSHQQVLQFEWALKYTTKSQKGGTPLQRRGKALYHLLSKEKWTCNSPLTTDVPLTIQVLIPFLPSVTPPPQLTIVCT
jgi:predicted GIY-YIG superfamily endonuclease